MGLEGRVVLSDAGENVVMRNLNEERRPQMECNHHDNGNELPGVRLHVY
jgi:hypothetical protein